MFTIASQLSHYTVHRYTVFCNTNKGNSQAGGPTVKLFHTEILHFDLKDTVS